MILLCYFIILKVVFLIISLEHLEDFHFNTSLPNVYARKLFPQKRYLKYNVRKIYLAQNDQTAFIEVVKKNVYQLWNIPTFSSGNPSLIPVYKSKEKFSWISGVDCKTIVIYSKNSFRFFRKSFVDWIFEKEYHLESQNLFKMSIYKDKIIASNTKDIYLIDNGLRVLTMSEYQNKFFIFPRSFNDTLMILSNPNYNQTDGIVDMYTFDDNHLKHVQQLTSLGTSGYFGNHCEIVHDRIIIAERFAKAVLPGAGKVNVFNFNGDLIQEIKCPENVSKDQQHILEFGRYFCSSENGRYLAITSCYGGQGKIFVYKYSERRKNYVKSHHIQDHKFNLSILGKQLSISNSGHLLFANDSNVYFLVPSQ